MKKNIFAIIVLYCAIFGFTSCSDDKDNYPAPSDITNIKAVPAPGSITLSWDLPEDKNIKYVEIRYSIPDLGKSYRKQVSTFTSSFALDDLLQKYGVIDFTLQPFNEGETGGKISTISAQAEKALPIYSNPEKIKLNPATMYTNAPFPTRALKFLVDGSVETFFHSQWQTTVKLPHYIVIDLGEEITAFKFKSTNTNRASDRSWKTMNVYGSNTYDPKQFFDGVAFVDGTTVSIAEAGTTLLASFTDLPGGTLEIYQSDIIPIETPVRWLWFETTETTDGASYFALSELELYKCEITYPE